MSSQQPLHQQEAIIDTLTAAATGNQQVKLTLAEQPTAIYPSCNSVSYTIDTLERTTIVGEATKLETQSDLPTFRLAPETADNPLTNSSLLIKPPDGDTRPTLYQTIDTPDPHLTAHTNLPHEMAPIAAVTHLK